MDLSFAAPTTGQRDPQTTGVPEAAARADAAAAAEAPGAAGPDQRAVRGRRSQPPELDVPAVLGATARPAAPQVARQPRE